MAYSFDKVMLACTSPDMTRDIDIEEGLESQPFSREQQRWGPPPRPLNLSPSTDDQGFIIMTDGGSQPKVHPRLSGEGKQNESQNAGRRNTHTQISSATKIDAPLGGQVC